MTETFLSFVKTRRSLLTLNTIWHRILSCALFICVLKLPRLAKSVRRAKSTRLYQFCIWCNFCIWCKSRKCLPWNNSKSSSFRVREPVTTNKACEIGHFCVKFNFHLWNNAQWLFRTNSASEQTAVGIVPLYIFPLENKMLQIRIEKVYPIEEKCLQDKPKTLRNWCDAWMVIEQLFQHSPFQ